MKQLSGGQVEMTEGEITSQSMGLLLNLGFYWRWRRFISLDSKRLVFPGFSLWVLC